jgi:hypothetical protein
LEADWRRGGCTKICPAVSACAQKCWEGENGKVCAEGCKKKFMGACPERFFGMCMFGGDPTLKW